MVEVRNSRILRAILLLITACFVSFPAQAQYGSGSGTVDDPYLIYTAEQMNAIGADSNDWDKHFELMADIDLSGYRGTDFNIIGYYVDWNDNKPFTGAFDGNGHTISNFSYTSTDTDYIGLFVYVEGQNAQIKDLRLINPNVDAGAGHDVGALVGYLRDGTITGCSVEGGSVSGGSNVGGLVGAHGELGVWPPFTISNCCSTSSVHGTRRVGGLVGYNDGTITNCYAAGSVTGTTDVGGLVGQNGSVLGVVNDKPVDGPGMIYDCYSTASVFATGSSSGGLVGTNYAGEITNCYATGSVEGPDNVGGLVGEKWGEVTASFWDIETSGQTISDGGIGKTTAEMQTATTFLDAGWDFVDETANGTEDIWWILEGQDYPRLWWELTGTEADPYIITDVTELQAIQHGLSACYALGNDIDASATKTWNDGAGFDPIGWRIDLNNYEGFTGKFDGRGHIIFDLFINRPFTDYVGLFGLILDGAEVKNVGLVDADITARRNSGSLVGYSSGATLSDSWSTGIVKGSYDDQMRLGGLIGRSTGENSFVTRCFSNATVIATGGAHQVGGLAGYNGHGSVMSDCYATGDVSGYWKVGGLVGDNIDGSEGTVIQRCYSTGRISSKFGGGGLVGFNWRNGITIDSFWDMETSRQISSYGGVGKTTAEMQMASTFLNASWDFVDETANGTEDIWWILEGQDYPRLWWELIP